MESLAENFGRGELIWSGWGGKTVDFLAGVLYEYLTQTTLHAAKKKEKELYVPIDS